MAELRPRAENGRPHRAARSPPIASASRSIRISARRTGASPTSRRSASTKANSRTCTARSRAPISLTSIACISSSRSARRSRIAPTTRIRSRITRTATRCACSADSLQRRRHERASRARARALHGGFLPRARRRGQPGARSDLHRRPAARGLDADRADPVEPPAVEGTMELPEIISITRSAAPRRRRAAAGRLSRRAGAHGAPMSCANSASNTSSARASIASSAGRSSSTRCRTISCTSA